jgi:hypothetical protein
MYGLTSCNGDIPFERSKWEKEVDGFYLYRNKMMDDLIYLTDFLGMPLFEVFSILGEHDG